MQISQLIGGEANPGGRADGNCKQRSSRSLTFKRWALEQSKEMLVAMSENDSVRNVKDCLDRLEKATSAGVIVSAVAAAGALAPSDGTSPIDLGVMKVPIVFAGSIAFVIFLLIIFSLFRLLAYLETALFQLPVEERPQAEVAIRSHLWFFNPFFEGGGRFAKITDNAGLFFLVVLWWIGAYSGIALLAKAGYAENIFDIMPRLIMTPALWPAGIAYALYLLIGGVSLRIMWRLVQELSTDQRNVRAKLVLNNIGALIGGFGVGLLFYLCGALT